MCNAKPGLRCAAHAREAIKSIEKQLRRASMSLPSDKKRERCANLAQKLEEAKFEYNLTQQGHKELQAKGENIDDLETISKNRREAAKSIEQIVQDGQHQVGPFSFDLSSKDLTESIESLTKTNKALEESLLHKLNSPSNSVDDENLKSLIEKKAEVSLGLAHFKKQRQDKEELNALSDRALNDKMHNLQHFLDAYDMSEEDFANQSLKVAAILSSNKHSQESLTESDFNSVSNGSNNPLVEAMIDEDTYSMLTSGAESFNSRASSENLAENILDSVNSYAYREDRPFSEVLKKYNQTRALAIVKGNNSHV